MLEKILKGSNHATEAEYLKVNLPKLVPGVNLCESEGGSL